MYVCVGREGRPVTGVWVAVETSEGVIQAELMATHEIIGRKWPARHIYYSARYAQSMLVASRLV